MNTEDESDDSSLHRKCGSGTKVYVADSRDRFYKEIKQMTSPQRCAKVRIPLYISFR